MMQTSELQERLNALGFDAGPVDGIDGPMTRTAVARFQLACAQPRHYLAVDGIAGPLTFAALQAVGNGALAPHFHVSELRTRTSLRGPKNGTCWVHRDLLLNLEELRARVGRPLPIVSAWRDVAHNSRVGGASQSQHTFGAAPELARIGHRLRAGSLLQAGRAADFNRGYITLDDCRALGLFSGIGWRRDGGRQWVTHVDVRTSASPQRPAVWQYR